MASNQPSATPTSEELDAFAALQHHLFSAVHISKTLANRWHLPIPNDPSLLDMSSPSLPFSPATRGPGGETTRKPIHLPPPRPPSPRRYPFADPPPRQSVPVHSTPYETRGPNTASRFTTIDREEGYARYDEDGRPLYRDEAPRGRDYVASRPPPYRDDVEMAHPSHELDRRAVDDAGYRRHDDTVRYMEHPSSSRDREYAKDDFMMKGGRNNSNQHGQQRDTMVHRRPLPLPIPSSDGPPPPPPPPPPPSHHDDPRYPSRPPLDMPHLHPADSGRSSVYPHTVPSQSQNPSSSPYDTHPHGTPMHHGLPHLSHHPHSHPHVGPPVTNPDGTLVHGMARPPITPATPGRRPASSITMNAQGQRTCKQCGQPGRYKDGRCIEKWGPGPAGPGTVCDRCRKRMKRVERRNALEAQLSREPAPHVHLTNPTLTPVQLTSHVSTPVAGEEEEADEMDEMRSVDTPRSRSPSRGRRPLSRAVPTTAPVPATTTSPGLASSSIYPWSKHHASNAPSTMVRVSSERTHPLRKVHSRSRSHSRGRTETDSEDEEDQVSGHETRRGDSDGESGSIHSMTRGSGGGDVDIEEQEPEMSGTSVPPHSVKTSPKSRAQPHGHHHRHPHWVVSRTSPVVEGTAVDSGLADSDAVSTAPSSGLTAVDSSQSSPASPAHLSLSPSLGKVLGKRRSPSAMGDRVERDMVKRKLGSGGDAQRQHQHSVPARVEA